MLKPGFITTWLFFIFKKPKMKKSNVNTKTLHQGVYKIVWTDGKNSLTKTVMILNYSP